MPDDPTPAAAPGDRQPDAEPDRMAQPVDAEQPPRLPFTVVGIGASAGGVEAVGEFLHAMRPDSGMAFVVVQHLPPDHTSLMAEVLGRRTAMPVGQVEDGVPVEPDRVYVIRPGHVLTIRDGRLHLGPKLGTPRAANRPVDDFFRSLAEEQRERAVAVVMSGMGSNGTAGCQAVKAVGGLCVAQDPESAQYPSMPRHLIDAGYADYIARPADLPDVLLTYAASHYATGGREADARPVLDREQQHLREILAVLRTRTRQDFTGYKKPTLLRRVQRRMGLTRIAAIADYARHLRQSPTEVTALADDLLIHVTGFFRDPEAWDALREKVVAPLVAAREPGGPVRAWAAACSSGEEAYSLAMLLVEESDRAGKRLDVKVFATDLAERALAHARAGVYPGGIESEIPPDRLRRFFVKEDEVYRVRQDLRDRVVFAPQNILQDPPFSRLDVATCRNLLIYLEPDVQQRVLALLHFGLREGGALFLGTSETVTGAEELFEPLDKKARIYRRVGPTRHGMVDLPVLRPLPADLGAGGPAPAPAADPPPPRLLGRAPLAELTRQALLEFHTPPAVTVDRDHRVVYYHGDTRAFLQQPGGEPTRDLLLLARDGVRGAARVALHRSAAQGGPVTVADGWVDLDAGRRARVAVTASPVPPTGGEPAAPPDYYVVSFERRGEVTAPGPADAPTTTDELARLRGELQSTIEELQTSNEELKASNEEVMSVNEELQSSNEELETSKEEMQSLNEELRTVNAQLRAKMEEHQAAASDLASLLASTDIAVLFLDTELRIRRFTPAVRDLLDLIPTDVGRPLAALARRFDDPDLDADSRAVLDRLVPVAREVAAASGRHYVRRVLPYRTTDNRIDGVVVTFVDITARKRAEDALAAEKEYAESIVQTLHEPLLVLHPDLTVRSVNPAFYTHFRVDPADTVGRKVYHLGNGQWDIPALRTLLEDVLPDSHVFNDYEVTHEFETLGRRVMLVNGRRLDHVQLILLGIRDITDRKRAEERQAFMLRLADALRPLTDPEAVQAEACRVLGGHLGADRVYYSEIDEAAGTAEVRRNYLRGASPSLVGPYRVADFGWIMPPLRRGETVVVPDVAASPLVSDADRPTLAAVRIGANVVAPLVKGGRLVGTLSVNEPAPRAWTDAEVTLVEETAERIWAAVERAKAERELSAELAAMTRLRELADRLLGMSDLPDALGEVLDTAVALHGADFGTVQVYDAAADGLRYAATRGFDAAALAAVPPVCRDFHSTCASALRTGAPVVVADLATDPGFAAHAATAAALGYRAAFSFPLTTRRGEFLGVLTVHFREPHPPADRELRWAALYAPMAAHLIERRRAEEAQRAGEERYRALVETQVEMVCQFRPDGTLLFVNEAYARAFGKTREELTGTSFWDMIPADEHAGVRARLAALTPESPQVQIENMVTAAGGPRWTLWTNRALAFDAAGRVTEAQSVGVDITDRKRAEAALAASEERLRLALDAARMGTWTFDPAADAHTRDANLNALLGLPAAETTTPFAEFLDHVHPADRAAVRAGFDRSVRHGQPLRLEFRVVRPDGSVRWLRDQGDAFGAAGRVRLAGAVVDVTDRREAEERLRLVLASATDFAIFTLAPDRTVTTWSPGAAAVLGWSEGEMVGRSGDDIFTPEDRAAGAPAAEADTARRDGRAADERWHVRKDGSRFFAGGVMTPLGDPGRGFVKVLRDLTDKKRAEDELHAARVDLERRVAERTGELEVALDALEGEMARRQELSRRLAAASEAERRRISRDLHDSVGQLLTGLSLAAKAARGADRLPPAATGKLDDVLRLSDAIGKELHALAVRLRPTALDDVGLGAAVAQLVAEWTARVGVPVDYQATGLEPERLPAELETTLYRVVQEALTNVAKHARAGRVAVVLTRLGDEATAVVEDDGGGFDPATAGKGRLGLVGMRERLALVGGTLEVESAPGSGTTVIARVPLGGDRPAG